MRGGVLATLDEMRDATQRGIEIAASHGTGSLEAAVAHGLAAIASAILYQAEVSRMAASVSQRALADQKGIMAGALEALMGLDDT